MMTFKMFMAITNLQTNKTVKKIHRSTGLKTALKSFDITKNKNKMRYGLCNRLRIDICCIGGIFMKLFLGKKVGVSKEEKSLPYYKFFEREMAKIPAEKIALLDKPSESEIVPFEQKNLFLRGEDKNFCQIGYGVAKNGVGFVCNETYMQNVKPEMLDWWFAWHSVGSDLRYKIWDPEDHYFARADNAAYVCDEKVPVNQKTWGVNHYIIEDIGNGPGFLKIGFKRPADYGLDEKIKELLK